MTLKHALCRHYRTDLTRCFQQFRLGAVLFFMGLVVVYGATQLLSPSLAQEIVTLLGLIVIATGFVMAILAQIRMLIARLLRFWER